MKEGNNVPTPPESDVTDSFYYSESLPSFEFLFFFGRTSRLGRCMQMQDIASATGREKSAQRRNADIKKTRNHLDNVIQVLAVFFSLPLDFLKINIG